MILPMLIEAPLLITVIVIIIPIKVLLATGVPTLCAITLIIILRIFILLGLLRIHFVCDLYKNLIKFNLNH